MAKLAAKNLTYSLNSVSLEDELNSLEQNVEQEVIDVQGFSSSGPENVVGNYTYNYSLGGNADFAASQGDATIFGLIGNSGVASDFGPTGNTAAAGDPHYESTSVVLGTYTISGATGAAITYSAELTGNAALTRETS